MSLPKEKETFRMKEITVFEEALANKNQDKKINPNLLYSYKSSKKANLEYIDFQDVIWDAEIEPIVSECKKQGIEYITISSCFSHLLSTVNLFISAGCTLVGLINITDMYAPSYSDVKTKPALLIKL